MANDNTRLFIIIGLILVGALLYQYGDFFGISLTSPEVQYYNKPIQAEFLLMNYSNPTINIFFNNKEILQFDANDSNQTVSFTKNIVNGTYDFSIEGIEEKGTLKIVVSENNMTESKTIDVQQPYIALTHNIPNTGDEGDTLKISVSTTNPQGELLVADSVLIDVTNPDNSIDTLTLTKSGDNYETNFNYKDSGTYQFKIKASKLDYKTKEYSAVTTVIKTGGIHPVVWIVMIAIILFVILFGIKFVRTR